MKALRDRTESMTDRHERQQDRQRLAITVYQEAIPTGKDRGHECNLLLLKSVGSFLCHEQGRGEW